MPHDPMQKVDSLKELALVLQFCPNSLKMKSSISHISYYIKPATAWKQLGKVKHKAPRLTQRNIFVNSDLSKWSIVDIYLVFFNACIHNMNKEK